MAIVFHPFHPQPLFGDDYTALRRFLIRLDNANYHFGRWDWMITHNYLDAGALPKIGLWSEDGEVVAAATYDCEPGKAFLLTLPGYENLREEMLAYAEKALQKDGTFAVLIPDGDAPFQALAARKGYMATDDQEHEAIFDLTTGAFNYALPDGFRITSMRETYDLYRYGQVLWKGFDHERNEGPFVMKDTYAGAFERPNVDLDLKIAVVASGGDFVSFCGMWHDPHSQSALVEPVATDPAYRNRGLGRAAVLEGLRRCARRGARRAFVGSSQAFYYAIGFRPYSSNRYWTRKPMVQ